MRRQLLMLALLLFAILDLHLFYWNGNAGRRNAVHPEIVPLIDVHDQPETAVETESASFGDGIRAALSDKRYADLETLAAELRAPDRRFRGGTAEVTRFYDIVTEVKRLPSDDPCTCTRLDPASFEAKKIQLEAWHAAVPEQPTSAIALAQLWLQAAWAARGTSYGSEVTEEQWAKMAENVAHAREYLETIDPDQDPVAYSVMIDMAEATSDRKKIDALYRAAIEVYPTYFEYYAQRADILQTKWFGRPGELAAYLDSLVTPERGLNGQIAYAFAAYRLRYAYKQPDTAGSDILRFRTIVTAYQARERRFGLRPHDWKMLFYFSLHGGMTVSAIQAFQRMGTDWDGAIWWTREGFDSDVAWYKAHIESMAWATHLVND
jgi:hypothetical protein